jgi:hypothetical protein
MMRFTLVLAVWMGLAPVVSASLAPRKEPAAWGSRTTQVRAAQLLSRAVSQAAAETPRTEYQLTEETEILLNDKPCRYADVPANARTVRMELAADKKTVLKVHFRTPR